MRFLEKFRDISTRSEIKIRTSSSPRSHTNSSLSSLFSLLSSFSDSGDSSVELNLHNKKEIKEMDEEKDNWEREDNMIDEHQ